MRKINLNILVAVCVFLAVLAGAAAADTHYVDPNDSIQAAIDAASDYDEIEVAPGTYTEAIDFKGKAVRLYSSGGPGATTIDGNNANHVVQCVSGEDANTILEGFTITDGNANGSSGPYFNGGGMLNSGSSPTVTNCIFTVNTADYGGGMYNSGSSPTVTDCNFINNIAMHSGGGMYSKDDSNSIVNNCTFIGNDALGTAADNGGGGMYNFYSNPTVTNCTFSSNSAPWEGGGMHNSNSSPTMTNCMFSGNSSTSGGVMHNYYSSPILTNCEFLGN